MAGTHQTVTWRKTGAHRFQHHLRLGTAQALEGVLKTILLADLFNITSACHPLASGPSAPGERLPPLAAIGDAHTMPGRGHCSENSTTLSVAHATGLHHLRQGRGLAPGMRTTTASSTEAPSQVSRIGKLKRSSLTPSSPSASTRRHTFLSQAPGTAAQHYS